MNNLKNDLTGMKVGRLTVIKYISLKNSRVMYLCKCECGNEIEVRSDSLTSGHTQSCGCLLKESRARNGKKNKKYNEYFEKDSETMGCYFHNDPGIFYFDKIDYDKVKSYCWVKNGDGYAITRMVDKNKKARGVLFHRFILDFPDGEVDHKDRDRANNKRRNLRVVTSQENSMNLSKRKDNTTGVAGVARDEKNDRWRASLTFKNKKVVDKSFHSFREAVIFRLQAEKHFYGEFAPQKHLFKSYGI